MTRREKLLNVLGWVFVGFFITTFVTNYLHPYPKVEGLAGVVLEIFVDIYVPVVLAMLGLVVPILWLLNYFGSKTKPMAADSNLPLFILSGAAWSGVSIVLATAFLVKFASPYFWPCMLTGGVITFVGALISFFLIGKTNAPGAEELRACPIDPEVINSAVEAALRLKEAKKRF